MTTTDSTDADEIRSIEPEKVAEQLTAALEATEVDEKDYHIHEALQLLAVTDE